MRKIAIVLGLSLLFSSHAIGDAANGEFLAFQIGQRVSVEDPSQIKYSEVTVPGSESILSWVTTQSVNRDIASVQLEISLTSLTILGIKGKIPFDAADEARNIMLRYYRVLGEKYPSWRPNGCSFPGPTYWCSLSSPKPGYSFKLYACVDMCDFQEVWITLQPMGNRYKSLEAVRLREQDEYMRNRQRNKDAETDKTGL